VRATLHDELMHEAGFETDYHRKLELRRERRRRTRTNAAAIFGSLAFIAAGAVALGADYLPVIPRPIVGAALLIVAIVGLVQLVNWVRYRVVPWMKDQI